MPATLPAAPPAAPFTPAATPPPPLPDPAQGFELVDGKLQELPVTYESSHTAGEVYGHLRDHVRPRRLGWVAPEGTAFRCFPDDPTRVRRADTAFHVFSRLTREQARAEGFCTVAPDLAVEVVSPNDLAAEVERKRVEWLAAGVRLVWIVHPETRTVAAYHADGTARLFGPADELTGEPVLPEFRVPVVELFRLPGDDPAGGGA